MLDSVKLLEEIAWYSRAGGGVTAHFLAKHTHISYRRVTKLLRECSHLGLVIFEVRRHRKNCLKKVYSLTAGGRATLETVRLWRAVN